MTSTIRVIRQMRAGIPYLHIVIFIVVIVVSVVIVFIAVIPQSLFTQLALFSSEGLNPGPLLSPNEDEVNGFTWMFFTCYLHTPDLLEDFVAHQSHPHKSSKDEELDKWIYGHALGQCNGEYYTPNKTFNR